MVQIKFRARLQKFQVVVLMPGRRNSAEWQELVRNNSRLWLVQIAIGRYQLNELGTSTSSNYRKHSFRIHWRLMGMSSMSTYVCRTLARIPTMNFGQGCLPASGRTLLMMELHVLGHMEIMSGRRGYNNFNS